MSKQEAGWDIKTYILQLIVRYMYVQEKYAVSLLFLPPRTLSDSTPENLSLPLPHLVSSMAPMLHLPL